MPTEIPDMSWVDSAKAQGRKEVSGAELNKKYEAALEKYTLLRNSNNLYSRIENALQKKQQELSAKSQSLPKGAESWQTTFSQLSLEKQNFCDASGLYFKALLKHWDKGLAADELEDIVQRVNTLLATAGKKQELATVENLKSKEQADLKNLEAKSFLVSGQFVNVSDTGTELAKPWGIQWHLNPAWFKKEGVQYKAVFEYFIPKTLNSKVTALTLGLWRTKPKAESAATGYKLDLTKVKRGEWQTAEMENLPELSGFSGYLYFDANSKDAYDSAEKIKIKSIKLVPKEK